VQILKELRSKIKMEKLAAIILAGGKGKRMKLKGINKAALPLGGKPIIVHVVNKLNDLNINPVIVVVGFASKSIIDILGNRVIFAKQQQQLGTANAVSCALKEMPSNIETVLVLGGDDSAFYPKDTINNFIKSHFKEKADLSFLTIKTDNPGGLGRVNRDEDGKIVGIIEDKDATPEQKRIKEINPGCYIFQVSFLRQYLNKVKKSPATGEYYLTSLVDIAIKNKKKIVVANAGNILWRGVNTLEELMEAERIFTNLK
jgi:bifunctional UDP-N-acetylglucosamine pyrophosphorylase / glucosamine-1-phosphate N-acetyltransferase